MAQHTPQTLGEAWAVYDRHGITHPDRPLDDSTFSVARAICKIEKQRDDLLKACHLLIGTVDDFLPNIGNCVLQDYERLNQGLIKGRAAIAKATES